ncbi:MAG: 30S ribosome-binding factor RbfA [Candidatus Doudnabacteria bacterium]|nr:30S ribosome-binding factor RbfA [Candidatus Doudnabacteria bacterium]
MSRRTEKVQSLLQQEIGDYILLLELPALTTISKVEVTPDLKWCKTWITIMGDQKNQDKVMDVLNENLRDLQKELNQNLTMRFVPKVKFVVDHGEEYAAKINELLRKANDDK